MHFLTAATTLLAALATTATAITTLKPDGKRCIAGYANEDASMYMGPTLGTQNYHSHTGFVTDPNGKIISEMSQRFNSWQTFTSVLPYTVDMYCGQDTSKTLTRCTSVEVRYAGQDIQSKADSTNCVCGKDDTVFDAKGYCACYFDCPL
ncbi:uncharacterized protein BO66DRAFT_456587 [Aspergillus aculeatinus CBS 121060]|uniref:Uncharacterized protein n=1 Tax=Aspergillus aculeatinus CBS 121060 TaxID=1448322 RepID=A0ACD1H2P0_9EURO|nr:hypothetical protein BO66DRAFT_456587 [Aspergillus aculeatinus CBS 121060]RAH67823.1 hypothetical protein BO66DRAFT_456587 [Aspergillus aculeatinus CBS 121060]